MAGHFRSDDIVDMLDVLDGIFDPDEIVTDRAVRAARRRARRTVKPDDTDAAA